MPGATAGRIPLAPGITYERQLLFTPHGPEVIHVMTAPKPGGLYALHPVLSNDSVIGRERVTSMQKRLASTATLGGVNADLFTFNEGLPSGMFMEAGVVATPPHPKRSTVGITNDGRLLVQRVQMLGTWQGNSQRRPLNALNQRPGPEGVSLFTPAWGSATPAATDTVEITLSGVPPAVSLTDLTGTVVSVKPAGGTPIPPGGAVLVGRGTSAGRLASEAPVGQQVTSRLVLRPQWAGVVDAVGGGPLIVQNGQPVFRALEQFSSSQLSVRNPRTAVGQRADGRIIFMTVDGRQPGYSTGLTNFELAQQMVRLGAVTASSLDAGGSTTMAFDGKLLNQPSDPGGERAVADGLFVFYYGVQAPAPSVQVLSPNGDGVDEVESLSFKIVRPSTVTASLIGPDRVPRQTMTGLKEAGTYDLSWNGRTAQGAAEPEGRWRWVINAIDDRGQESRAERSLLPQQHSRLSACEPVPRGRPQTRRVAPSVLPARASRAGRARDPDRERRDGLDRPPPVPGRPCEHALERPLWERGARVLGPLRRQPARGQLVRPGAARAQVRSSPRAASGLSRLLCNL